MAYTKPPDAELLRAALYGYEREREIIHGKMDEIRRQLGGAPRRAAVETQPVRRGMSEEGKLRIAAAQRERWAKLRKKDGATARPKRNMSAEGRQRIIEATRKRWAAYRAAKATTE
jgi:hypothetical protein